MAVKWKKMTKDKPKNLKLIKVESKDKKTVFDRH